MHVVHKIIKLSVIAGLIVMAGGTVGLCGDYDGSNPLLGAVIEIHECRPGLACQKVTPTEADMPRFVEIDFKNKIISEVGKNKDRRSTAIKALERLDDRLVLRGGDNGRGWTMTIMAETGDMVATVSGEKTGFVVFGACTLR